MKPIRHVRTAFQFATLLALLLPSVASAQITYNQFVGAKVSGGGATLSIYKGDPNFREKLTFEDMSFLTVQVNGEYYTNNPDGGKIGPSGQTGVSPHALMNADTRRVGRDTIRSIWKEDGFDIIQNVYPVQFTNSGVIVLSVKIVNHQAVALNAQAQFLLDNENSNTMGPPDSSNDNPFIVNRYGYIRNWQLCPPNPLPSFYLAFEFPPTETKVGTVGICYVNDTFPPRPLGLLPLSLVQFGNWPDQVYYTWGPVGQGDQHDLTDEAALLMGQPMAATAFTPGVYDSVTEIFKTAYGTPEWCYEHGKVVGFALYPHHLYWDPVSGTYTPNPFQVETFLFNVEDGALGNTTIRQTVQDPVRIVQPKPTGPSRDTTQVQSAGSIRGGGFADLRWIDSAVVLPTGCASSFGVDVRFDVKIAGDTASPFAEPWDCSLTIDCPNPDILPPSFVNSFRGCDSIFYDTVTVDDSRQFDLGLDSIGYSSYDLNAGQYKVAFGTPAPYLCTRNSVKVYVQQLDTLRAGHVVLTFRDCANNISRDTICFTKHPPLPDLTAPVFHDTAATDCHTLCTQKIVTDTAKGATSIDRGVDSIVVVSQTNMTLSGVPSGGKYPASTPMATVKVCVTDSMKDGMMVLRANDTAHNASYDTIRYCTTPDVKAPIVSWQQFDPATSAWRVHVADTQAWDRGIDSVWIEQAGNTVTIPSPIPNPLGCKPTYDFSVRVLDTTKCARATVRARDCAGNISTPGILSFSKNAKPVITPPKAVLCSSTDSVILDAGGNYSSYLWSTGETTKKIVVRKAGSYTVTVDDGEGCGATSDPILVTFSPAKTTVIPPGPLTMCEPDSAQLDAGVGYVTYQWLKAGKPIAGATAQKVWLKATGSYSVITSNAEGCSDTSAPVSVTVNPIPPKPVITLSNSVLSSTPAASYQWMESGNVISGATQQTYTPPGAGVYSVRITDANGCSNTSDPFSNVGSITVYVPSMIRAAQSEHITIPLGLKDSQSVPLANRTYTVRLRFNKTLLIPDWPGANPTVQGSDLVVQFSGSTNVANGIIQNFPFIAALGNDSCTTVIIDTFFWSTPSIAVKKQNGVFCLTDLCQQGGTRLIDPQGKVRLSAKPNPAQDNAVLDYELIESGETTIIVYDLLGREVLRLVDGEQGKGVYAVSADLSSLPAGIYVCTLHTPTIVKSQRLQIVR